MLLILLFVIIFAASITLLVVSSRLHRYWRDKYDEAQYRWTKALGGTLAERDAARDKKIASDKDDLWEGIKNFAIGCIIVFKFALIICGMILIINHGSASRNRIYQEETYAAIKYAETDLDATIDFTYYENIISYNAEVRKHQRWNDSLWTNWFIPDFWDELPLIEYDLIGPPAP